MQPPRPQVPARLAIACTLGPESAPGRVQQWASVNEHLLGREHRAGVIEARYTGGQGVRSQLAALVAAEQHCCSHLGWELTDDGDTVTLRVRGSEDDLDYFEG